MRLKAILSVISTLLIVAISYYPLFSADFVNIDDVSYLIQNQLVKNPNIFLIFDIKTLTVADWTPVVTISHAIEYKIFGLNPTGYHLVNLLLHLTTGILLFILLVKVGIKRSQALLVVTIFLIHPLQVETVGWISARKNLLAALFGSLYLLLYLKGQRLPALLSLILALGSKGTSVVFPILLLALILREKPTKKHLCWVFIGFVLAFARGMLSVYSQEVVSSARLAGQIDLIERLAVMGPVFVTQLRQFFLPYDLSFQYKWGTHYWSEPIVILSWSLLCLTGIIAYLCRRTDKWLGIGLLIATIVILPTANIVPSPEFQADRYAHLAIVGISVSLVSVVDKFSSRLLWGIIYAWLCILTYFSYQYSQVWQNSESLWQSVLRKYDNYSFGWYHLALYYIENNRYSLAERALLKTLSIDPTHEDARYNLSSIYFNTTRITEAVDQIRTLIETSPKPEYLRKYAKYLAYAGRREESLEIIKTEETLDRDPLATKFTKIEVYLALNESGLAWATTKDLIDRFGANMKYLNTLKKLDIDLYEKTKKYVSTMPSR